MGEVWEVGKIKIKVINILEYLCCDYDTLMKVYFNTNLSGSLQIFQQL